MWHSECWRAVLILARCGAKGSEDNIDTHPGRLCTQYSVGIFYTAASGAGPVSIGFSEQSSSQLHVVRGISYIMLSPLFEESIMKTEKLHNLKGANDGIAGWAQCSCCLAAKISDIATASSSSSSSLIVMAISCH